MSASRTKFYLDKKNAKVMGVLRGDRDTPASTSTWVGVGTVLLASPPADGSCSPTSSPAGSLEPTAGL